MFLISDGSVNVGWVILCQIYQTVYTPMTTILQPQDISPALCKHGLYGKFLYFSTWM